jgi:hypothetical protein
MFRKLLIAAGFALLGFFLLACAGIGAQNSRPVVVITSPPGGSVYTVGQQVAVQSGSADPAGIIRVALIVDGVTVHEDPSPIATGQEQYPLIQTWIADKPGQHSIVVRATNAQGVTADTGVYITVQEGAAAIFTPVSVPPTAAPAAAPTNAVVTVTVSATSALTESLTTTPTAPANAPTESPATTTTVTAGAACVDNAAFVADLTIPDGTSFSPNASFSKSWRVLNSGTCAWQNYALVFVSDTQLAQAATIPVPPTAAGSTVDLTLSMIAPAASGTYMGTWRLRNASSTLFGTVLTVSINVATSNAAAVNTAAPTAAATNTAAPAPTIAGGAACSGQPGNFSFTASQATITAGQSVTLNWGAVNNASIAVLNGGSFNNQGVPAPGNITDSPTATTTYTLTATCSNGGATRTKSVTVTISGSAACSNPTIGSFVGGPAAITFGQPFTITWSNVIGADKILVQGVNGQLNVEDSSGSHTFFPTKTWTYNMIASCSTTGQVATKSVTVNVTGGCSGVPSSFSFTADHTTIKSGQTVTLSWSGVSNADDVRLYVPAGGYYEVVGLGPTGNHEFQPQTTSKYQLIAFCNASGTQRSEQIKVTVNP